MTRATCHEMAVGVEDIARAIRDVSRPYFSSSSLKAGRPLIVE